MITLLLKSSVVIILLLAFYKLILEKESFFAVNRIYLLACLVLSGLLPFVTLPELVHHQGIVETVIQPIEPPITTIAAKSTPTEKKVEVQPAQGSPIELTASSAEEASLKANITKEKLGERLPTLPPKAATKNAITLTLQAFSLVDWLLVFYFFGVLILSLNFLAQIGSLVLRIFKNTDKIKDDDGIIVNMNAVIEPCSFFNYIFINPASYDFDTYEQIIVHEKIHVQKGHTLDLLLAELAVVILWFNPFIWLFRKEVEKNIEYQTDALLIKNTPKQKEGYQMNLLKIATYNKPLTVVTNYNQSLIKQRILKMNSKQSTPYSYWKYAFLMPLLLITVLVLNKPFALANDNLSAIEIVESANLDKPTIEESSQAKEATTPTNKYSAKEKKMIIPNTLEKNEIPNKIKEIKESASTTAGSDCEKLLEAIESGDLNKVRRILSTFDPNCMPYANSDDYKNIKRINSIAKNGGQILLDTENELIIIEGRRILLSNHSYDLPSDFGNEIKDDCAGIQKALVKGDTKSVKEILMNMDKACIEDADDPDEVADLMLTQKILRNGGSVSISTSRMTIDWDELASKEMNSKTGFYQQKSQKEEVNSANDFNGINEATTDCKTLLEAISANNLAQVKTLLKTIDPNCLERDPGYEIRELENGMNWRRTKPQTPLVAAARVGNLAIGKLLVEAGAKVNFYGKRNEPPLIATAEIGDTPFTKFLLAKGADLSYNTNAYGSALNAAARHGYTETMAYLLKAGSDIDATTNGQGTPLNAAARHGHITAMKLLIDNGADINSQNNGQGSALNAAARHGHLEAVELLLVKGADINQQNNGQGSALSAAARHGYADVVKSLLAKGAAIDAETNGQGSALNAAARHGHIEVVKLLLEKGADIDVQNNGQGSALNAAARHGHLDIVKLLLEKGANIDQQTNGQGSALNAATRHGQIDIVKLLLEKGANIDQQTNGQGSALNAAARHGQMDIVQLLIEKGAAINAQTNGQGSALNAAARHGNLEIAKFLLAKGANVNKMNNGQGTALMQATKNNDYKMVELLLKHGADPYLNPNHQKSPITYAYDAGNERMVELLKRYKAN